MKHLLCFRFWAATLLSGTAALTLPACGDFQKDIDVPLPTYSAELVVECYLEPGVVPRLTVTESVPYLAAVTPVVPLDVRVTLTLPNGRELPLPFRPGRDTLTDKFHTHMGTAPLVARPGDTFRLDVRDSKGRHVTGTATMTELVPIDSMEYKFNDKTGDERKAYILTTFRDPPTPGNYYRLLMHKRDSIYRAPDQDRLFEDLLFNGRSVPMGTSYRFSPGDTVTSTLYHIDAAYYRFRRSTRDARNANGNPFAQPSAIYNTVQGGIGVFTILNYQRRRIVLPL
ncbi:hypothetical protein GCM10023185_44500 [Hymenobacter saemangeumensis]|uniref:DUF4249 domain-containing protein n=1 Tax=Hymenobacter saemangeumensis TaxID=1084522 RepID=A0ABP8ITH5_9BACT